MRGASRERARLRVLNATQPNRQARNEIKCWQAQKLGLETAQEVDLSDVLELQIKLARRDGGIFPPHSDLIRRLEREVILDQVTRTEFKKRSAEILRLDMGLGSETRRAFAKTQRQFGRL